MVKCVASSNHGIDMVHKLCVDQPEAIRQKRKFRLKKWCSGRSSSVSVMVKSQYRLRADDWTFALQ
jgi:hypothetical protein